MIAFFHNPMADFVLESVRFLKYTQEPDDRVKLAHCSLLTEYMDSHEVWQAFSCSSFKILSLLFRNNLIASIGKKPEFVAFRAKVQSIQDPKMIQRLQDGQMPVTKEQARLVKEYAEHLYRQIDGIEGSSNLLDYLCNMQIASHIDDEYLLKVSNKFCSIIADENRALSVLFYDYMLFLFAVNDKNTVTNKRWIRNEMCRTQLLWQDEYYEKQLSQMAVFNYSSSLPTSEVDAINECAVHNPIALAKKVMITNTEELSSEMESMSKNVMGFLITRMDISPVYPKPETIRVHGEDRKVDKIHLEQIKSLLNERGYRYLNQLRPEEYLQGMYQRSMQLIGNMIAFLSAEDLYNEVRHLVEPENVYLIDYCESLKLAHITQLFPVLEAKVHNLGKLCGIFPFKQNKEEFMLYKEPSTILRNIIWDIYKETNSLELVPDILFIYDCMYNSNGFSIRNECIHGRKYNMQEELPFALKTTCLAILMVNQRIHIILNKME